MAQPGPRELVRGAKFRVARDSCAHHFPPGAVVTLATPYAGLPPGRWYVEEANDYYRAMYPGDYDAAKGDQRKRLYVAAADLEAIPPAAPKPFEFVQGKRYRVVADNCGHKHAIGSVVTAARPYAGESWYVDPPRAGGQMVLGPCDVDPTPVPDDPPAAPKPFEFVKGKRYRITGDNCNHTKPVGSVVTAGDRLGGGLDVPGSAWHGAVRIDEGGWYVQTRDVDPTPVPDEAPPAAKDWARGQRLRVKGDAVSSVCKQYFPDGREVTFDCWHPTYDQNAAPGYCRKAFCVVEEPEGRKSGSDRYLWPESVTALPAAAPAPKPVPASPVGPGATVLVVADTSSHSAPLGCELVVHGWRGVGTNAARADDDPLKEFVVAKADHYPSGGPSGNYLRVRDVLAAGDPLLADPEVADTARTCREGWARHAACQAEAAKAKDAALAAGKLLAAAREKAAARVKEAADKEAFTKAVREVTTAHSGLTLSDSLVAKLAERLALKKP